MTGPSFEQFDPSLRELVAILWRRRGVAILAFVIVLVALVGVIANWQPGYRATAEVGLIPVVTASGDRASDGAGPRAGELTAQQIETVIAEMRSEETLATALAVLRGAGIGFDPGGVENSLANDPAPQIGTPETGAINWLRARFGAERIGHSAVIEASFVTTDATVSQAALQAIVESYVWQREDRQKHVIRSRLEDADSQLATARGDLFAREGDLLAWQQQAGMLDQEEGALMLERIYALDEQAEKIGQEVATLELAARRRAMANGLDDLLAIPDIAGHPMVAQLSQRYETERQEFDRLDQRYGPKHPVMQGRQKVLDDLYAQLVDAAMTVSGQMGDALASARERLRLITGQRDLWQSRLNDRHARTQGQGQLQRAVALARDNVDQLSRHVQTLHRELASFRGDLEILQSPTLPVSAEFPAKRDLMALAIMVALFAAVIAALLRHYFDQTIADDFEPQDVLGVPLYARIPARNMTDGRGLATDAGGDEAIGHLAVLMRIVDQNRKPPPTGSTAQIIAIGSAQTGEGKSHIAHALASRFAGLGHKTLLIDGDLHDPTGGENSNRVFADLVALLSGETDVTGFKDTAAKADGQTGQYWHLGARMAVPGSIATGLTERHLGPLVDQLRDQFDYIILDTPPILSVADGLVAMGLADVRLFVLRHGSSKKRDAKDALDRLATAGIVASGIVLNGGPARPAYGRADMSQTMGDRA
ncbi:GumC family protein [Thalassospira povalilytica]|uniref:GumC family protein n=1 Tax=Thalassospira povalilytica TaxID=732237 RepID=UPI003AA8B8C0